MTRDNTEAPEAPRRLRLATLGSLELLAAEPEPLLRAVKPLLIPAVLATLPGASAERSYLAELIWPSDDPKLSRGSLRQALHHLRLYGHGGGVEAGGARVWIDRDALDVDLWAFESAIRERDYAAAVELHRGVFCGDLQGPIRPELARWLDAQNDRIEVALQAAYSELIAECLAHGAIASALAYAQAWAGANPLSERAQLSLIRTLHAAGDPVRALQVYEGYRSLLASELGGVVEPDTARGLERLREEAVRTPEPTRVVYVANGGVAGEASAPPPRTRWRVDPVVVLGGAVALALALSVFAVWQNLPRAGVREPDRAWVLSAVGTEPALFEWTGDHLRRVDFGFAGPGAVPSPSLQRQALTVPAPLGENLGVVDEGGDTILVTSEDFDEHAIAWSPDGRRLLIVKGSVAPGTTTDHRWRAQLLDVETGRVTALGDDELWGREGDWSPDGTRLAYAVTGEEGRRVVLAEPSGRVLSVLGGSGGATAPAFSPDGRALAYADAIGRAVFVDRLDGSDPIPVVSAAERPVSTPLWLDAATIAYRHGEGPEAEFRRVNAFSGEPLGAEPLPWLGPLRRIDDASGDSVWIESVTIAELSPLVSPGQWLSLQAHASDPRGRALIPRSALAWSTSAPGVASVDSLGLLRVHAAGSVTLSVDLAGWRSADVRLDAVELRLQESGPVMVEDWRGGLDPTVWDAFGSPRSYVREEGAPGGGYLVSHGDSHYASGVISRWAFPAREGVTVEFLGQAPFTGEHYQGLVVALSPESPGEPLDAWVPDRAVAMDLHGQTGSLTAHSFRGPTVPLPVPPEEWHTYALQLGRGDTLSVVVDGRLVLRGPALPPWSSGDSLRVLLYGSSLGVEVKHGPVRVYLGERYRLVSPTER